MCLKSKTTFGCGHRIKYTELCEEPNCSSIDRWKFPANKDCPRCKAAGEASSRGKEGLGRHGREIRTRENRQQSSDSYSIPSSPSYSGSPRLSISPWAESDRSRKEKKWDTPTRQMADAAWLVEHECRMSELEETTSKLSLSSHRQSCFDSPTPSPRGSYEKIIEADEVEEPLDMDDVPPSQSKAIGMLPYEISRDSDKSSSRRRGRKIEHDIDMGPSHHHKAAPETPHRRPHFGTSSKYPEEPTQHQFIHKPRRSKTEPNYPQSCFRDVPVTILPNSPVVGGPWINHYESNQPLQHDAYYPRTYQVY